MTGRLGAGGAPAGRLPIRRQRYDNAQILEPRAIWPEVLAWREKGVKESQA